MISVFRFQCRGSDEPTSSSLARASLSVIVLLSHDHVSVTTAPGQRVKKDLEHRLGFSLQSCALRYLACELGSFSSDRKRVMK